MSNNHNSAEVFNTLAGGILRDATITEIRIFEENYILKIVVVLNTVRNGIIKIRFESVVEYYFNYDSSRAFYNVEDYKFFYSVDTGEYYITFDPDRDANGISENDSDLIRAKSICLIE